MERELSEFWFGVYLMSCCLLPFVLHLVFDLIDWIRDKKEVQCYE